MRTHSGDLPSRRHAHSWSRPAKIGVSAGLALLALSIGVGGAYALGDVGRGLALANVAEPQPHVTPMPTWKEIDIPEPGPVTFTFVAAGDVLPHEGVVQSATSNGKLDFTPVFKPVQPYIEGADLAICHMEVPVTPDGRLSGFPRFSAPEALARDLGKSGWDGCSTASNHSADRGWEGIVATLDAFDKFHMGHSGTARSRGESNNAQIYNIRDGSRIIKVAHISWTYSLNGLPEPSGKPWSVNNFDPSKPDVSGLIKQAKRARAEGADVVIASVHCCVEYVSYPTGTQEAIAKKIAESGEVDLLVGHHAHVPQPMAKLKGGPSGNGMWVAYGLGNFVSNQYPECCSINATSGLLLTATFTVELDGTVNVDAEWTAITVDRGDHHKVYVLKDILKNGTKGISPAEAKARYNRVKDVAGKQAEERTEPATHLAQYMYYEERKPWKAAT